MNTDLYTKAILTVIAASLLYLCAERTISPPTALAQAAEQKVVISGWFNSTGIGSIQRFGNYGMPVAIDYPLAGQSGPAVKTIGSAK